MAIHIQNFEHLPTPNYLDIYLVVMQFSFFFFPSIKYAEKLPACAI